MNVDERIEMARDKAANAYPKLVELLREGLNYSQIGNEGPYKTKVREFLATLKEDE